ncbi:hypothetical protein BZG36_01533 [Bifiguratus adelaidae]|uniref:Uncharacterized protein n=1 Tax=Bifiguratus adelaidae TaxID=1938954 RepID=A0A261Y463_9FUNG|nr:hypothetical protein BZG36_01533 [Bifiguratus adelaidae]
MDEASLFDIGITSVQETIKALAIFLEQVTALNDTLHHPQHIPKHQPSPSAPSHEDVHTPKRHSSHPSNHAPSVAYTRFHARSVPTISIQAYLTRILKYCPCNNEVFLSLLVYFNRMTERNGSFVVDSYNVHRLIISGVMVSAKFFSDVFFTNSRYAKVGGLPVGELNTLEVEFLALNDFSLYISVPELQAWGDLIFQLRKSPSELREHLARDGASFPLIVGDLKASTTAIP